MSPLLKIPEPKKNLNIINFQKSLFLLCAQEAYA